MIRGRPVSAILPVYNGARFLAEAIDSVLRQDYDPLEIIVVDDGSTDDTAGIARRFGNRIRYMYQTRRGPPAGRNAGLLAAGGELIAFLDADDLWSVDKLKLQATLLDQQSELLVALGLRRRMELKGNVDGIERFVVCSEAEMALNLGCGLFRRSVFESVGWFDESLLHCDDWDWFMRAREHGVRLLVHNDVTLFGRRHGANLSNDVEAGRTATIKMLKKSIDRRRRSKGVAESLPEVERLSLHVIGNEREGHRG